MTKFKSESKENNVIDIADLSDKFENIDELPEMQEFMDNMNIEVGAKAGHQINVNHYTNTFHYRLKYWTYP